MESLNQTIFLALNAPEHPSRAVLLAAIALAQYAIFLVPVLLAALWLWGDRGSRGGVLLAFIGGELALGLNQVASLLWYHPRPFAVPIGQTLVAHVADSSFPSDHVTFLLAVGIGLAAWTHERWAGTLVVLLAAPVAWARVYLGIHFPFDMLGAIPVAGAGILIAQPFRSWVEGTIMPRLAEPLYRRVFSVPIGRGWVRS